MKRLGTFAFWSAVVGLAVAIGCSDEDTTFERCTTWIDQTCVGEIKEIKLCNSVDAHGVCRSARYKLGDVPFECASCVDCNTASQVAKAACLGSDAGAVIISTCDAPASTTTDTGGGTTPEAAVVTPDAGSVDVAVSVPEASAVDVAVAVDSGVAADVATE